MMSRELFGHYDLTNLAVLKIEDLRGRVSLGHDYGLVGEKLLARGRVIRPGRTVTVCVGDVVAVDGGHETLVATLLATMMRVTGERPVSAPAAQTERHHQSVVHSRRSRRWCLCRAWKTQATRGDHAEREDRRPSDQ